MHQWSPIAPLRVAANQNAMKFRTHFGTFWIYGAPIRSRRFRLGGRVVTPHGVSENASAKANSTRYRAIAAPLRDFGRDDRANATRGGFRGGAVALCT